MRVLRMAAICTVVAGSIIGLGAAPASAGELCDQVWVGGQWVSPVVPAGAYGTCMPYNGTFCHWQDDGADPQVHVYAYICVPDPVTTP
ncbi:MAG: hypothetical protein QOC82_2346 [Frankiaceae bacterium]|nr:hypothetical protein [Frankiaceae bacterium]MDQ1700379.1 hypothetical protein [Frankiaceae bacterium]